MKKIIVLIVLIISVNSISAYTQTLQNTKWGIYIPTGELEAYFYFANDTLFSSYDNITFEVNSTYKVTDNNLSMVDVKGEDCNLVDTGRYTFLIKNDTLKFTLVSDLCVNRTKSLPFIYCVRLQTGIENTNNLIEIKLYPNPASEEVFIQVNNDVIGSNYFISDQLGRKVLSGILTSESTSIDIHELSPGMYFLQIDGNNMQILKFIKK